MSKYHPKRKPSQFLYFAHFEFYSNGPTGQSIINRLDKLKEENILIAFARVVGDSFSGPYLLASKLPFRSLKHHLRESFKDVSPKITYTSENAIKEMPCLEGHPIRRKREFLKTVLNLEYVEGKGYIPSKENKEEEQSDTTKDKAENKGISIIEKEFEGIVGLNNIKKSMRKIYHLLEVQKKRKKEKLPANPVTLHSVFRGPPGTGKTTVAKILGALYKELGVLEKGHVVSVERGDLVAGFIGHTEQKTKKQLQKAIGGILFIDEAYSLTRGEHDTKDYGKEVIETLVPFMENNKDKIAVIVAGYEDKMDQFIKSNEGLKSRFTQYYDFKSYTTDELTEIFKVQLSNEGYKIHKKVFNLHISHFLKEYKKTQDPRTFGNAREIRNIIDELKMIQADRIQTTDVEKNNLDVLEYITSADIKTLCHNYSIKPAQFIPRKKKSG
tara:strand:+ start:1000 stop:2322 length:1323 start_codon:yes stop_codon:yes gene_type:complete